MDYKLLLDTAVMAGELMLANGAETYRVEDTMHRMLSLSGLKTAEAFVMVTGFLVTLDDPSIQSMTVTRRIQSRGQIFVLSMKLTPFPAASAAGKSNCRRPSGRSSG